MLTLGCREVGNHSLTNAIYTTLDRTHKTTATDYCIQILELNTALGQSIEDNLQTPIELVGNRGKACNLLGSVTQREGLNLLHITEQSNLC